MSSWADERGAIDSAREQLGERYPGARIEILETFDVAWAGWDGDSKGALIAVDGFPTLVAVDQTVEEGHFEFEIFKQQSEYRRLLDDTARVLSSLWNRRASRGDRREPPSEADRLLTQIYRRLGYVEQLGQHGRRHVLEALKLAANEAVAHVDRHGGEWQLLRDPGESDDEYAARKLLLGGDKPEVRELKRQLARAVIYATEAAAAWDQPAFLRSINMPEDWIVRSFEDADSVPLREFIAVYEAAAARAGWRPLHAIVREVTHRQRFKEWP